MSLNVTLSQKKDLKVQQGTSMFNNWITFSYVSLLLTLIIREDDTSIWSGSQYHGPFTSSDPHATVALLFCIQSSYKRADGCPSNQVNWDSCLIQSPYDANLRAAPGTRTTKNKWIHSVTRFSTSSFKRVYTSHQFSKYSGPVQTC